MSNEEKTTMDKKTKALPKISEIHSKIYDLLEPLNSEARQNVIRAALTLLGETATGAAAGSISSGAVSSASEPTLVGLSPRGSAWIKQNGLTSAQVERVFDISNQGVSLIASEAPGKNSKEQTHNAYVLEGVRALLASGEASFDDKAARKACEDLGCYNKANHATYMSDKGNVITGSKGSGWKLTAPGLRRGADLVKELTKEG
jgi:hypothetical protein